MPPRSNNHLQRAERRRKIEAMLALYIDSAEVARRISGEYGVTQRQVYLDIQVVLKQLESTHPPRAVRRLRVLRSLERLYQKCIQASDFRAAVMVQDKICRIEGLYAPEVIEMDHSGSIGRPDDATQTAVDGVRLMPTSHQRGRMAELLARANADRTRLPASSAPFIEVGSTAPPQRERTATATPAASDDDQADAEPGPRAAVA